MFPQMKSMLVNVMQIIIPDDGARRDRTVLAATE